METRPQLAGTKKRNKVVMSRKRTAVTKKKTMKMAVPPKIREKEEAEQKAVDEMVVEDEAEEMAYDSDDDGYQDESDYENADDSSTE